MALTPLKRAHRSPLRENNFAIPPSPAMTKLGGGCGVNVYRLRRSLTQEGQEQSPWAVKKVNHLARSNISERLALEASILKELRHPNIVGFRGITGTEDGSLCLAMEDCHMSLMDMIDERVFLEEHFTYQQVVKAAWSMAKALEYLHFEKKILHGDMKSGNVLIRGNFEAVKVCDFGVALKLKDDLSGLADPKKRYVGSEPWKSKEVLNQNKGGKVTDKADIFAYGLVIWEMLTLTVPHVDLLGTGPTTLESSMSCEEEEDPEEYLAALGTRPPLLRENFDKSFAPVLDVFHCCTYEEPEKRPSSKDIVNALRPHAEQLQILDN